MYGFIEVCQEGTKDTGHSHCTSLVLMCTFDKVLGMIEFELFDQHVFYFGRF